MKSVTLIAFVVVLCFGSPLIGGDAKDEPIKADAFKWEMKVLEMPYGLKFKSAAKTKIDIVFNKMVRQNDALKITVEFTKDIEDVKSLELALRHFTTKGKYPRLYVHFFDSDNVSLAKSPLQYKIGEVTGKAGDAIRMLFVWTVSDSYTSKIKKIELRFHDEM